MIAEVFVTKSGLTRLAPPFTQMLERGRWLS
jgi:hypothetical protein